MRTAFFMQEPILNECRCPRCDTTAARALHSFSKCPCRPPPHGLLIKDLAQRPDEDRRARVNEHTRSVLQNALCCRAKPPTWHHRLLEVESVKKAQEFAQNSVEADPSTTIQVAKAEHIERR